MVKVLYVITGLGKGGAERQLYYLIKNLPKGYEAKVCAFVDGYFSEKIRSLGVEVRILKGGLSAFGEFKGILDEFKPDIVHSWLTHANLFCKISKVFLRQNYIQISCIRAKDIGDLHYNFLERLLDPLGDKIAVNAYTTKNFLLRYFAFNPKKIEVIYNGFEDVVSKNRNIKKELGLEGKKIITTVANFRKQKDYPTNIKTAIELLKKRDDFAFIYVGEGREQKKVEGLISKSGVSGHIKLVGSRNDVPEILRASDIFFLPTLYEGQSNVLIEAMRHKCPILTTDIPENSEIIANGKEGLLVERGQAEKMAEMIDGLLNNKALSKKIAQEAFKKSEKLFSNKIMAKKYISLYQDTIKENRISK